MADPAHVPAGRFAKAALERADLWREVAPSVVPFPDVRGALAAVATGQADAAIVYETDAWVVDRVTVAALWPDSLSVPILYRCLPVADSPRIEAARRFCKIARSADVWERLGFRALELRPGR